VAASAAHHFFHDGDDVGVGGEVVDDAGAKGEGAVDAGVSASRPNSSGDSSSGMPRS
jgi:hypothetical protein